MKSPFNWVGNKYKYLDVINSLVKDKNYDNVMECFMGTGNIILNIECNANKFIGNDIAKLLPMMYKHIKNMDNFTMEYLENKLNQWNRFSTIEDYYELRAYWNNKYINNKFDDDFVYETAMLLKMCSNSMVRSTLRVNLTKDLEG